MKKKRMEFKWTIILSAKYSILDVLRLVAYCMYSIIHSVNIRSLLMNQNVSI